MRRICSFHGFHFFLCCNLILDFFRIVFAPIRRRIELAQRLDVKQATVSAVISRSSFPTLERIATALEVEPWQFLAPPSFVEELKQARAQRSSGGGGGLVAWWVSAVRSTRPTQCSSSAPSSSVWSVTKKLRSKSKKIPTGCKPCRDKTKWNERAQPYTSRSPRKSAPKRCKPSSIFCNCTSEIYVFPFLYWRIKVSLMPR